MDWLQFIADVVKSLVSLAWPIAFVAAVYMFKDRVAELLPRLNVKYKDFQVSLTKAEVRAEALPEPQEQPESTPEDDRFNQLLEVSPAVALVYLRRELELSLQRYAERRGLRDVPTYRLTRRLRKEGLIDDVTYDVISDLQLTASSAAHSDNEVSKTDAVRFREVAERVMRGLDLLGTAAQMPPPAPIGPHGP